MHILIIGSGTREHCLVRKLSQSKHTPRISCFGNHRNPGIVAHSTYYEIGDITDTCAIVTFARKAKITFVVIGPEAPLATGVADALWDAGIPVIGPRKQLAQLETSKSFTRKLLDTYNIDASPAYKYFTSMEGIERFVQHDCHGAFVIKHDGLKGGKGVLVIGDHFATIEEGLSICKEIIDTGEGFLIEEKLIGQEFSLLSFVDGKSIAHMIPVQDHKRAFEGDIGPNTGGMGTYSDSNHLLPFLSSEDIAIAQNINEQVAKAMQQEFSQAYQGIMYGGFMLTKHGIKIIEYNARFGDPEVFNLLLLLETDLVDIFLALIEQEIATINITFTKQASLCKYLVPQGYPETPVKGAELSVKQTPEHVQYFWGSVEEKEGKLYTLGSRAIAVIALGENIEDAEQKVETAMASFVGPLNHRKDIGTKPLLEEKVRMIQQL